MYRFLLKPTEQRSSEEPSDFPREFFSLCESSRLHLLRSITCSIKQSDTYTKSSSLLLSSHYGSAAILWCFPSNYLAREKKQPTKKKPTPQLTTYI